MKINTFFYSIKQGLKNIFRNKMFSLASIATMAACIFMFGLFYIIIANFTSTVHTIEKGVSVTVFFDKGLSEEEMKGIGDQISKRAEVSKMEFVSADEAWKDFQGVYFKGRESLAQGFAGALLLGVATSLPELASTIALFRLGNFDIAVGNIVGSNIFNFLILVVADILYTGTGLYSFADPSTQLLMACGAVAMVSTWLLLRLRGKAATLLCPLVTTVSYLAFLLIG